MSTEPTLGNIMDKLNTIPTKDDFGAVKTDIQAIKEHITSYQIESSNYMDKVDAELDSIHSTNEDHNERIEALEATIEQFKQDKLKNNIRLSGFSNGWSKDAGAVVLKIAQAIQLDLRQNDFYAYVVGRDSFIIVKFFNHNTKTLFLNKMRAKKSLMAEEIFSDTRSNNQIYANDHLTPFFSGLFAVAWRAKKNGQLATATSNGGCIRVKKSMEGASIVITNMLQLHKIIDNTEEIIEGNGNMETDESHAAENNTENSNSSTTQETASSSSNTGNRVPSPVVSLQRLNNQPVTQRQTRAKRNQSSQRQTSSQYDIQEHQPRFTFPRNNEINNEQITSNIIGNPNPAPKRKAPGGHKHHHQFNPYKKPATGETVKKKK